MAEYFSSLMDPLDILINNAGTSVAEDFIDFNVDHWNTIINVNLRAPALISKIIAKRMIKNKKGAIINVSSNTTRIHF